MIRRTLRFLWLQYVALSAILFCAAVAWGVRSCVRFDEISYHRFEYPTGQFVQFVLASDAGRVRLYYFDHPRVHALAMPPQGWRTDTGTYIDWFEPFRWSNITNIELSGLTALLEDEPAGATRLSLPYWFIAILSLPLPVIEMRRWRTRGKAVLKGLCPVCGYDLRASPQRCPECGTAIEAKTSVP